MRAIIEQPPEPGSPVASLWRRLVWLAAIASSAAISTALVAWGLKALLPMH